MNRTVASAKRLADPTRGANKGFEMNIDDITNENIRGIDFERENRQAFLSSIPMSRKHRDAEVSPGILASNVFGEDVSGADRRSVKAQLAGRGDYRPAWWAICCYLQQKLARKKSLQHAMYRFHNVHHFFTLRWLVFTCDVNELAQDMRRYGFGRAIRNYCMRKYIGMRE
jgi:hypothetical protein